MTKSSFFAVAAAAASASATAISFSSSSSSSSSSRQEGGLNNDTKQIRPAPAPAEKFAPRFDGLRFIETLVTAHR
ncbi:hypothetical protein LINGRAHAP2_LOCUS28898 [Linum grandiflorum]